MLQWRSSSEALHSAREARDKLFTQRKRRARCEVLVVCVCFELSMRVLSELSLFECFQTQGLSLLMEGRL
jgi:hypothetical protein